MWPISILHVPSISILSCACQMLVLISLYPLVAYAASICRAFERNMRQLRLYPRVIRTSLLGHRPHQLVPRNLHNNHHPNSLPSLLSSPRSLYERPQMEAGRTSLHPVCAHMYYEVQAFTSFHGRLVAIVCRRCYWRVGGMVVAAVVELK